MAIDARLIPLADADYLQRLRGIDALIIRDPVTNLPAEPGDPRLVGPLLTLANDPTKNVRAAVAWTLGIIASTEEGTESKKQLCEALGSEHWRIRFAVARAYQWLCDQPFAPLLPLLDDEMESVRWATASTLAARNGWRLGRKGRSFDPALIPHLLHALADTAPTVRAAAIRGMEPGDSEEAYAALEAGLRDVDYRVRIWPSGVLRDPRAVPALVAALDDSFLWVRANAARNLGAIGDRRAFEPLIAQLRTRNRYMRREATWALASLGDPSAVDALRSLHDRSTTEWVRAPAREAIEKLIGGD